MVESVDTPDLKSCGQQWPCRFDPGSEYETGRRHRRRPVLYYMKSPSSRPFRNLPAVRRHDHLFAPIESLASLDFGENRITNTDLSKPADPALKKVIVDPGYEFELVTTLFKNRPDVSIVTE